MKKFRNIEKIIRGKNSHWVGDGFYVKQYFPAGQEKNFLERVSPFLLLDYNEPYFFQASKYTVGVGAHPHRGFETVTISISGKVEHHDNKGNHGIIEAGDVQWMTAGKGILHKEYHEKEYSKKGRSFHMLQLWVNLPKKDKMTDPKYQALLKENMGKLYLENGNGEVSVIAGEVKGVKGPASTFSPINLYRVDLEKGANIVLEEKAEYNTMILITAGEFLLNETEKVVAGDFVLFENVEGDIKLEANSETAMAVVMSGEPLNEPIVKYGPFVMNTSEEIMQANIDFHNGMFGETNF